MSDLLAEDLEGVLERTRDHWEELRGERLFITGGTGFFGCWLLESLLWADRRLSLGAKAVILTRDPAAFARRRPHLAESPALSFLRGDVRTFEFPKGRFSHMIHAAAAASQKVNEEEPLLMLDTIAQGTRRALEFACRCGGPKFLFTSSGAVYGPQPEKTPRLREDHRGGPDTLSPSSAYAEGKRVAEWLCAAYARQNRIPVKIVRGFAFVGPYLPLHAHFAIGNFIADALARRPIAVRGDGRPFRSYLYAADLAVWLWTILFKGETLRPYNVGSEEALSVAALARTVAKTLSPGLRVAIVKKAAGSGRPERYVPSTRRARLELGLKQTVGLAEAIRRTAAWHAGV